MINCDEHLMFPGEGHDPQQTRHPSPQPQERDRGLQQTNQLQPPGPQIINCPVKSFSIKLSILSSILNYECAKIDILPLGHNLKPHSDISAGGMRWDGDRFTTSLSKQMLQTNCYSCLSYDQCISFIRKAASKIIMILCCGHCRM